ncbi:hypothetical protein EYF80_023964 [Liparis tanakae]|uniref:Uncharacterized protein n=1 Tax=Liparis tanakae TaxID=230148 RepID=A0A4Z2HLZ8_9TELE|nr:hypothetical protein EYF80_023964 [Liparis tanakae]
MPDLDEALARGLVVDSSPRLLRGVRLFDVDVESVDRVAALVHRKVSLASEGMPTPAMLAARTWNWYFLFSFRSHTWRQRDYPTNSLASLDASQDTTTDVSVFLVGTTLLGADGMSVDHNV